MSAINLLDLFEISSTLYKPTSIEKAEFPAGNDPEKNNKKKDCKGFHRGNSHLSRHKKT